MIEYNLSESFDFLMTEGRHHMDERQVNILVVTNNFFSVDEEQKAIIQETVNNSVITVTTQKNVTDDMLSKAEIIFGSPRPDDLKKAVNLRWIQLPSAGADGFTNKNLYVNDDIVLTNCSGVFGLPIAEHVFAMILSFNRNLNEYFLLKQEKKWSMIKETKDFFGSTIGVIGFGDIGQEVAKRAKALGARVLAVKRNPSSKPDYVDELYMTEDIDEVLKQSDYVVLTLPATDKTRGIINEDRLKIMKPDAFLVNIGRGELVDQEALIKALKNNWIGGAGLDVMTPEPLPADNPLWDMSNVMITQHSSGFSRGNNDRRMKIFLDNLKRYLNKENLMNVVDFTEGY